MTQPSLPYALVVDDEPLIVIDTSFILEDAGFQPMEAGSGEEARALLEEHQSKVALLFSDVDMPGSLDGFGLARHVAEHWPHIEIVIASGRVLPQAGDMPDKATFIAKPFNRHTVLGHLRRNLPQNVQPEPLAHPI